MRSLNVAISQMVVSADCRKNSEVIQGIMEEAASKGHGLIQFPEGALSGCVKTQITGWSEVDWIALDDGLDAIKKAAKRLNIWVVLGSVHRLEVPKRPYNSLYVISNEGEIHARYDKRILSYTEQRDWYSAGEMPVVFEVSGIKIGLALCIEVQFPEVFAAYGRLNVDIVLLSSYSDDPMFEITARAHASLNTFWVGFCIPVDKAGRLQSHLIGPDGLLQASTDAVTSSLAVGSIAPEASEWEIPLQKAKPWRRSVRETDWFARVIL